MAHYLPSVVVPPILARLRHESESFILPAEEDDLRRYLAERRAAGTRLNLNQLGEAILGEEEAARRLAAYMALLAREDVEYISVKVSSVSSQINLVAFRPTIERSQGPSAGALPPGRAASLPPSRRPHHPEVRQPGHGGVPRPRPHRHGPSARCSTRRSSCPCPPAWCCRPICPTPIACSAISRTGRSSAARGAARRSSSASSRARTSPWSGSRASCTAGRRRRTPRSRRSTPTTCACSSTAAGRDRARAVHLGIATHNLFDVAYGLLLREDEGVEPWVEFEMLEGMANHQARAVQARAGGAPALRAGGAGRGLRERHRLPRAAARREHRRGQLPAPRVRPRAGLAGLGARARPVPRRARPRRSRVRCAAADTGPRGRVERGGSAGGRPGGAIRQ